MSSKPAGGPAPQGSTETVKVMVRVRPMNSKEKGRGKDTDYHNKEMPKKVFEI
jgi:hypothetical protein